MSLEPLERDIAKQLGKLNSAAGIDPAKPPAARIELGDVLMTGGSGRRPIHAAKLVAPPESPKPQSFPGLTEGEAQLARSIKLPA